MESTAVGGKQIVYGRIHYSESNIMMLNIMALVFGRMPEQAPFFIKPLLRTVANKAEQGTSNSVTPSAIPLTRMFPYI